MSKLASLDDDRASINLQGEDVELLKHLQKILEKKLMMKLSYRQIVKRCLLKEFEAENAK